MVEQILEYAGANAKRRDLEQERIELNALVKEVVEEHRPLLEDDGFDVEIDFESLSPEPIVVLGDRDSLIQAMSNLLTNAMKYSNGTRWIKVSTTKSDRFAMLSVEDRGIGISRTDQKKVFEPFFRASSVMDRTD